MNRKSKRLKMGKNRKGDMVDHISNLPDCILHHILSFIPTKEVVRTSILSTRWNNLWASVPNIDFDDTLFWDNFSDDGLNNVRKSGVQLRTSFLNFIEKVLKLRGTSNIKKFRLSCFGTYEESEIPTSQIHSWISDAIMHNVQELLMHFFRDDPSMIPWSMFDGTSLVSLKIRTNNATEIPSCISFPCLQTLHLGDVVFPNDGHLEKLLLGCPVIEELALSDIWTNLKNVVISNSTLKSLIIDDLSAVKPTYDPASGCKINIDAPNVTYFGYKGYLPNEILFNNVSSIVEACIYIPPEWQSEVTPRVIGLLKRLQHVVSVTLCRRTIVSITLEKNIQARFPVFPNLSHLMLDMQIGKNTFKAVMDLLPFCPVLQSICFTEGFKRSMNLYENNSVWSSIPICMSNCLKTVTFKKFHGNYSEVWFLKCVLKYARVLERMNIWWVNTRLLDLEKKTNVRKELAMVKKSSTACVIKFS